MIMQMLFVRFVKTWPAVDMQKGLQVLFEDPMIDIPIATYTHTRVIIKGKDNKYRSDWLLYTISHNEPKDKILFCIVFLIFLYKQFVNSYSFQYLFSHQHKEFLMTIPVQLIKYFLWFVTSWFYFHISYLFVLK